MEGRKRERKEVSEREWKENVKEARTTTGRKEEVMWKLGGCVASGLENTKGEIVMEQQTEKRKYGREGRGLER